MASRGARASAEQVTVVSAGVAASLALAADTDEGAVPGTQGDTSMVRGAEPLGVLRFATGAGARGEAPAGAAQATLGERGPWLQGEGRPGAPERSPRSLLARLRSFPCLGFISHPDIHPSPC